MFCLNENNIYHLYTQGIDMRKGVEGLCGIIRTYQYSPTNQEVYVFANKSRTLVKMLHWERGGFVVYYKRLEQGRLSPSIFHHKNAAVFIDIRWDEIVLLMEGIRLGTKNDIILSKKSFDNQRCFRNFTLIINESIKYEYKGRISRMAPKIGTAVCRTARTVV